MGKLTGKIAIVTGAGRGIGAAIAELFAKEGAQVAVLSYTQKNIDRTVASIKNAGGDAIGIACDIFDLEAIDNAVAAVIKHYGGVDILINNAHDTMDVTSSVMGITAEHLSRQFQSGPVSVLQFMRACQPVMVERGGGRIVNMASGAGINGAENYAPYSMAKEAVRSLTRSSAREWGQYGITVNNLCPVSITEGLQLAIDKGFDPVPDTPVPRYGSPEKDIAPIVLFLSSDDSQYITGYTLMADGGMFIDSAR
jgi:NAD(P)-dependent dehydrogenase (short-subunit alcohol dehydrogenase family)